GRHGPTATAPPMCCAAAHGKAIPPIFASPAAINTTPTCAISRTDSVWRARLRAREHLVMMESTITRRRLLSTALLGAGALAVPGATSTAAATPAPKEALL